MPVLERDAARARIRAEASIPRAHGCSGTNSPKARRFPLSWRQATAVPVALPGPGQKAPISQLYDQRQ